MKSRNGYGEKDGRGKTSARKAPRVARSKPNSTSSVLPSDPTLKIPDCETLTNSVEDFRLLDVYQEALRDLMCFYNRVTELDGHGWTAADVKRLEEIRQLLASYVRVAV